MGKIDFTSMKRERQMIEDAAPDSVPAALEESYSNVWGSSQEKIIYVEVSRLKAYIDKDGNGQPYKLNDKKVKQIAASAEDIGIITPLRVRPKGTEYEVVSGHHRLAAAKELNLLTVPCIVKDCTDEEVFKILSESNIQRDKTLPSEYARIFAKYTELRKDSETTMNEVAQKFAVSKKTLYRYLDLNNLIPELLDMVDDGVVNFGAAEYITKLPDSVQNDLYEVIKERGVKLSVPIAKRIRGLAESGEPIDREKLSAAFDNKTEQKKTLKNVYDGIRKKYNVEDSDDELEEIISILLDDYYNNN